MTYHLSFEYKDEPQSEVLIHTCEHIHHYCHIQIGNQQHHTQHRFCIGVNQSAVEPAYAFTDREILLLGIESLIVVINATNAEMIHAEGELTSVQSIEAMGECYIASCENQIACFTATGKTLWRQHLPDIIEAIQESIGYLTIQFMDHSPLCLTLETGQPQT